MPRQRVTNNKRLRQPRAQLGRRRRGRGSRKGGRSRGGSHYVETFPVSIKVGTTEDLKVSALTHLPADFPFRIQYIHFVGVTGYTPSSDNKNAGGFYAPNAVQLTLCNSLSAGAVNIVSSGPVMLGPIPRNVKVHQPRSEDWWQPTTDKNVVFARITAICMGSNLPAPPTRYIRGIIHVYIKLGAIIGTPNCKILWTHLPSGSSIGCMVNDEEFERARNSSSSTPGEPGEIEDLSTPGTSGAMSSPGLTGDFENIEI